MMVNIITFTIHQKSVANSSLYYNPISTKNVFDKLESLAWLRMSLISDVCVILSRYVR